MQGQYTKMALWRVESEGSHWNGWLEWEGAVNLFFFVSFGFLSCLGRGKFIGRKLGVVFLFIHNTYVLFYLSDK